MEGYYVISNPNGSRAVRQGRALIRYLQQIAERSYHFPGHSHFDDGVANLVIAQLLFLESEDPEKDINIYINSPGE